VSKGIQKWSEEVIAQRLAAGFGAGDGPNYKPWVGVHDIASAGRTHRVWSPIYQRTIHCLSDVEFRTFILLEASRKFSQLYEGFPLDRKVTQEIAAALQIAHPSYPGTRIPAVMTVDFIGVEQTGRQTLVTAFDCKTTGDAEDERVIAKLEITRAYFAGRGVAHHLVFDSQLPQQKIKNLEWIRGGVLKENGVEPYDGCFREKADQMFHDFTQGSFTCPLREYCEAFDRRHGLRSGDALYIVRELLWDHRLMCNLNHPNIPALPLNSFIVKREQGAQRAVGE